MSKEMDLLNSVRLEASKRGMYSFRTNVGKVRMKDGRFFDTGLPKGFSDVIVIRKDGVICFIETKIKPNKPRLEQCNFLLSMIKYGCPAGVAYTVEEAMKIVEWDKDFAKNMQHAIEGVKLIYEHKNTIK